MVNALSLCVLSLSACATQVSDDGAKASTTDGSDETATTTEQSDLDGDTGTTGEAVDAFVPDDGRYVSSDFRLKEDSCGMDEFVSLGSLMPSNYNLTAAADSGSFLLASSEQRTETGCSAGALDPESGLAIFTCDTFREGYRSPYGDGFDMEVSFAGEVTEDQVVAGGLTVTLHCMVGSYCDEFARNGIEFPCTIGGDLVLEPIDQ
jgi:hypothetical protein